MKRSTWIVLGLFLLLASLTIYLNQKEPATEETEITPSATAEFLLSDSDGLPTRISIESDTGEQVVIARKETGEWAVKQPLEAEADQGAAEAAATQLKALRVISHPEVDPDIVGLNRPSYTMIVKLTSGSEKTVRIGELAPTGSGYYANTNNSEEVLILSQNGLDSLLNLLESPPYESTATPSSLQD